MKKNPNYLNYCFKIIGLGFSDIIKSSNYKSIFVSDIVYSDSNDSISFVYLDVVLLNNYSFNISLDFVEDRFSISAYNNSSFRCYKSITGNLPSCCATSYVCFGGSD